MAIRFLAVACSRTAVAFIRIRRAAHYIRVPKGTLMEAKATTVRLDI